MNKLDDTIKVLMWCKKYEKEINHICIESNIGNAVFNDTLIGIYFVNKQQIDIYNGVYEVNGEDDSVEYTSIEEVLDFMTEYLRNNAIVKVGDIIKFKTDSMVLFEDEELLDWVIEQEENEVVKFEVREVNISSRLFYIENCPYAISFDENFEKEK